MIVRKCNVCGKVYDEPWVENRTETIGELAVHPPVIVHPDTGRREHNREDIDLCSDCVKKVLNLIDVMKTNGGEYLLIVDPDKYDFILREE